MNFLNNMLRIIENLEKTHKSQGIFIAIGNGIGYDDALNFLSFTDDLNNYNEQIPHL